MPELAWTHAGGIQILTTATVPVTDRGFLFGDSIYETLRAYSGVIFAWSEHCQRLHRSALALGIEPPHTDEELLSICQRLVDASREGETLPDTALRVVVSRGSTTMGLIPEGEPQARVVLVARPIPRGGAVQEQGVSVLLVHGPRASGRGVGPGLKTGNYLPSVLAARDAHAQGHHEAIFVEDGWVREGASSNIFAVLGTSLVTPPEEGVLPGITRSVVLQLVAESVDLGLELSQRPISEAELLAAEELFICSSIRELVPVVRVGEQSIGDGGVGPKVRALQTLWRRRVGV